MAGIDVKLGLDYASFKKGMNEATSSVKALDEQLKLNESFLKLNGNQEQYMANKAFILKQQIEAQTQVCNNAASALEAMRQKGVEPTSKEFQTMQGNVYKAQAKLISMRAELQSVEKGGEDAAGGLKKTDEAVNSIDKNKAWDNVASGLKDLTSKLESGARAAVNFGKKILGSFKESTGWADELLTMSAQTGIDVQTLQQMEKVADIVDTDVDAIIAAKKRMSKAVAGEGREDIADLFGINITGSENPEDLFWDIGEALMGMGESFDKEAAAQKVFGRNWNELLPLFKMGREEYERMVQEQTYLTEEQVKNLGQADDTIKQLEQEIAQMKNQFWSENADKITGLLTWLKENAEDVKGALIVIGAGFGALKLAEFAANLQQIITGFQSLGLLGGGKAMLGGGAASGLGSGAGAGAAASGGSGLIGGGAAAAGGGALFAMGEVAAAILLAYPMAKKISEEGLETFNPANYEQGKATGDVLNMISPGAGDAYYKLLHPERYGSAGGHSFGEPDETEAKLDRMCELAEQGNQEQREANQNAPTAADLALFNQIPDLMESAVIRGMSQVTIVIDERGVDAIGHRAGRSMWNNVITAAK